MSPEMIAIIAVGIALAGLMLRGHQSLDKRMDGFDKRMDGFEKRMDGFDKRMGGFDERLRAIETGQAELKGTILGKLDFIERYIIARNLQDSGASPEPGSASTAES